MKTGEADGQKGRWAGGQGGQKRTGWTLADEADIRRQGGLGGRDGLEGFSFARSSWLVARGSTALPLSFGRGELMRMAAPGYYKEAPHDRVPVRVTSAQVTTVTP